MLHEFSRTEMVIGTENLNKLKNSSVAIFGIGGVGTFVVEALTRSGVGKFIIVDNDDIAITNINRQIHATRKTIGMSKVEAMKERIKEINPKAEVICFNELYNSESAERLLFDKFDYVVDAIDMVSSKLDLIGRCSEKNIPLISSMGAGNKLNPTMLEVSDIYQTSICPLARVMRKELKRKGIKKLKVVYSKEKPVIPIDVGEVNHTRRQLPGSTSFVPPAAGLIIASEVVKDIIK
ncbi:tRNA threonylcarbamoyladenosine dehydratase [Senegalia sp. (in: firmicutes)]|uniref:tRNA threonylcarbamoyladenosine dehydratase n=2 Tax=Senegalia sp. (in: firmicutes) TaxID=1924098 RepID=UPI003F9661D0